MARSLGNVQAVAADQAVHAIGMPEAGVVIAQCATFPTTSTNASSSFVPVVCLFAFLRDFLGKPRSGGFWGGLIPAKTGLPKSVSLLYSQEMTGRFSVTFHRTFSIFGKESFTLPEL